ncbi:MULTISPECIES: DUF4105 domain-containing protein [unclassified Marinobacter]|uniref:lipoprotein N-acyltransferase Lnb domain-containing protein n=1 Tax=unclassified Marinobacter TaxID=83889 RepID=UPI000718C23E|nr:DUF4105 domain-containing protein [Marinobacter sp. LQ44]AMQ88580.1 hypothetical protein ASQ50_07650 [Marinobacter sp. LQ44]
MKIILIVVFCFLSLPSTLLAAKLNLDTITESQAQEIASLLYLGPNQDSKPNSFYLSETAVLDIELQALFEQNSTDSRCKFPARYYWLSLQENLTGNFSVEHCFNNTIANPFAESGVAATVIFADASNRSPMSYFGHILLGFSFNRGAPYFDHVVTFTADTGDSKSPIDTITKGVNGGFEGRFSEQVFHPIIEQYTNIENRSLTIFDLNIEHEKSILLYLHTKELQKTTYPYKFFSYNCSSEILRAIQAVKILEDNQEHLRIYPIDILNRLDKKGITNKNNATTMLALSKKDPTPENKKLFRSVITSNTQPIFTTPRKISTGVQKFGGKYYSGIGFKLGYKGIDSPFSTTLNDRNTFNFLDIEAVDINGSPKIKKINIIELESLNAKYISENTSIAWSYKTVIDRHSNQENELSDSSSIGVGIAHTTPRITISYLPEVAISIRENFATPRIKAEAFLYSQPFFFGIKHKTRSFINSKLTKQTEIVAAIQPLSNVQITARHELDSDSNSIHLEYFF